MLALVSKDIAPDDVQTPNVKELVLHHKNIRLFQGNSLDKNLFNEEFIDLTVTSPPYNVGIEYNSNDDTISYEKYLEFSKSGCKIVSLGVIRKPDFCLTYRSIKTKAAIKASAQI